VALELEIRELTTDEEARACATLMANSEPWLTLGRSCDDSFGIMTDPEREVYVAREGGEIVGFAVLQMRGAFVGYIQSVGVGPGARGRGIGSAIVRFAEERIFRESPNVFLCVSSFNERALRLYLRLGYEVVGELTDYIVSGHSEILLRKSTGPLSGFKSEP
jgi:ribosomal-protein-alanine N-acetyltransferase